MKVEIVSDKGKEEIEFDGNIIFPYYIDVLSMEHHPDKLVMRMCGKYKTKITPNYDTGNKKSDDRLWIMGIDKTPVTDGGKEERIM